jgi:acyl-CoA thioesterase FadM
MLTIRTKPLAATGATVTLAQDFWRGSETLAKARIKLVCVRVVNGQPARIPKAWRVALAIAGETN